MHIQEKKEYTNRKSYKVPDEDVTGKSGVCTTSAYRVVIKCQETGMVRLNVICYEGNNTKEII